MISVRSRDLGSKFNDLIFILAPIGEDKNGMPVSVLSGLARSHVDPRQEAAKLLQLPGEIATREIAAILIPLPRGTVSLLDPHEIAIRLVALLPRPTPHKYGSQQVQSSTSRQKLTTRPWSVYVEFMCFSLGIQFLIASHHMPANSRIGEVATKPGESLAAPPINGIP